jgi:DNA modification methylase
VQTETPVNDVVLCDAVALLGRLETGSVHLIIADPPYGVGYHSNYYKRRNPHAPMTNDWDFQIGPFVAECARVLAEGGALYLFSRWDVYPLWLPAIASTGLKVKTKIVWVKNNWSAGDLRGSFGNQYEEILFVVKGRHLLRGKRWSNVWHFDRVPANRMLHPTQKPVPLLMRAIQASSDIGDLVVDPFAGSGSTGEADGETGRDWLLGDVDPRMVNIARERLGLPLLRGDGQDGNALEEYRPEIPRPGEWGIHPEELRFLYDELKGNVRDAVA